VKKSIELHLLIILINRHLTENNWKYNTAAEK